jgi:pyridoxine/pyridoxamine 5'-phosphate oxidase
METPEPEGELLKKIERLEAGQVHLKQEMSKLKLSQRRRSHSVSPQRSRLGASASSSSSSSAAANKYNKGFSSPLQRESRLSHDPHHQNGGKYLNILQSIGHSIHILDLQCRIIYWLVTIFWCLIVFF